MSAGVLFDPASALRIARAVKTVEHSGPPADGTGVARRNPPLAPFWVQLSTEDPNNPGRYQWKMQTRANGAFAAAATATEGVTQDTKYYSARESNLTAGLDGRYAAIQFDGYDSSNGNSPLYVFVQGTAGVFPVTLATDGGSDGNAGVAPTYTYTATDYGGNQIGTKMTPAWARTIGSFQPATNGNMTVKNGTHVLLSCDEVPNTEASCQYTQAS